MANYFANSEIVSIFAAKKTIIIRLNHGKEIHFNR